MKNQDIYDFYQPSAMQQLVVERAVKIAAPSEGKHWKVCLNWELK
jgi:hypothetical protein